MKPKPTDAEVKNAVHQTLKDEGLLLPQTPEDMAAIEEGIERFPKTTMDHMAALKLAAKMRQPPAAESSDEAAFGNTIELGLAARNGASIPAEVWEKMKADKLKAKEGKAKNHG